MTKRLLTIFAASAMAVGFTASANYSFTFGEKNKPEESCTLLSWEGTAPANGKMEIPNYYTDRTEGKVYRVTKIADHALDNIPDVKEIVIPSNVEYIGDADYLGSGGTNNFFNCPQLTTFTVDENNRAFYSYLGCLRQRYSFCLQRVPTLWPTSDGKFILEINYQTIAPGAFAGNTTIKTIAFNSGITWTGDPGFSSMPNLSKYIKEGEEALEPALQIFNNIAYTLDGTKLLSCPPAQPLTTVTLLSSLKEIGPGAFENVKNLTYVGFTTNNMKFGEGAFRNCSNLQNAYIGGSGCSLGKSCFKGCSSLSDFNWDTDMDLGADSIFAGCGFTEITFAQRHLSMALNMGRGLFDGCQSLKKVDMSKLTGSEISGHVKFNAGVTSNCPNLKTFLFPEYTDFLGTAAGNPNMGFNSNIENIVLFNFTVQSQDSPVFEYTDKMHYPKVYYSPSQATYDHQLKSLFGFAYPGQYELTVYSAVNDVTFGPPTSRKNWIVPNATYYVPGGCYSNYADGFSYNCKINESYFMHNYNVNGNLVIKLETFASPSVEFKNIFVNDIHVGLPNSNGRLDTNQAVGTNMKAVLQYTLNSFPFTTYYASLRDISAGVENVNTDADDLEIRLTDGMMTFGESVEFAISDLSGKLLLAGKADAAATDNLPGGIYILKATAANGRTSVKKIAIR